ncbi:MAG TPA: hypothetical protein VK829_19715 [Terriglobales bacterium]|nr:hypothetical protein [Terriglobales bacterium]
MVSQGSTQSKRVYCDPSVLKNIQSAYQGAVLSHAASQTKLVQNEEEKGFPVYSTASGGYEAGGVQTGLAAGFKIEINGPLAATVHTHISGAGLPSSSTDNAAASSDKADTIAAVQSKADIYVISGQGLAVAATAANEAEVAKNVKWVIRGPNFGDWFKALKKQCQ